MTIPKQLLAFNRGVISSLGLARVDLKRMAFSAEEQSNWMPRVLGAAMLRPGLKFIARLNDDTNFGRQMPFTFGADDTATLEVSTNVMQVKINDIRISRTAVSSQLLNTGFDSDIASWTDDSDTGGSVSWLTGGYAGLIGDGTDFGKLNQTVAVDVADQNVEHFLEVVIEDGPVRFKVGSTAGDDDFFTEARLTRGTYSIAFTPTTTFTVELSNERTSNVRVDSVSVKTSAGDDTIATPWTSADLPFLRWDQSGDRIYVACNGVRQSTIERRGDGRSWGVTHYLPGNGPFRVQNVGGTTLAPSAINGDITLTASEPLFKQTHADNRSIFRIASSGQTVNSAISGEDSFSSPIRVTGNGTARVFSLIISDSFTATVTLQYSIGSDSGPWNDNAPNYTVPTSTSIDDGQDGQIIYYRIGVKSGDFGSGTVDVTLNYTGGSIQGIARVYAFTSNLVVSAHVLQDFGSTTASRDWWEGEWSDFRGHPTSTAIHEGRLWWAGRDSIFSSVSDQYSDFDDNTVGDAGPISRSIGSGPQRIIHWLMSMGRLLFGTSENTANIAAVKTDGNKPLGARSNSFDEPLTPTNFNIKTISSKGVFVDRTLQRVYELSYDLDEQDYVPIDLSVFAPDFNEIGITQIAVQMKPDMRIHCVRTDGTVGVLVYDRLESVICWIDVISDGADGEIEDVSVLPGTVEDQVYYIVKRTINGGTQRHLCKWALESEAIGGDMNKIADSFVEYDGAATTAPFTTEALHLRDEDVVVWADGLDVGTHTISATGGLNLAVAASKVVAGLGYRARFKGAKLGDIQVETATTAAGAGLLDLKKVGRIGFIAQNMHHLGLKYGSDFVTMYDLPQEYKSQAVVAGTVHSRYHEEDFPFGGDWDPDSRICLEANAPRPVTLLAAIAEMEDLES